MIRHYVYFGDGPLPSPSPALFIYPLWVYQCPIDIRSFSLLFNRKRICIPIYLYCILFYCSIVPIFHLINFFFFASFHIFFFHRNAAVSNHNFIPPIVSVGEGHGMSIMIDTSVEYSEFQSKLYKIETTRTKRVYQDPLCQGYVRSFLHGDSFLRLLFR